MFLKKHLEFKMKKELSHQIEHMKANNILYIYSFQ